MPNNPQNEIRSIHFMAVCGTGMGALAVLLKSAGYTVSGSDDNVYPPMSTYLIQHGIDIRQPFQAANLDTQPDLVVVGNAITRQNPEAQAMIARGVPYCSMPEAINRFVVGPKMPLVITGTHGKTTTSALVAWMLHTAGLDPAFLIGGILKNFNQNARLGDGPQVVLEGDEYDTAFFDKEPKFLHYIPGIAVLTSVEFDHADIFRDLDHIKEKFSRFIQQMTPTQTLVACLDDPTVRELIKKAPCEVVGYGRHIESQWATTGFEVRPPDCCYTVLHQGAPFVTIQSPLMGQHNLQNTLAAMAVSHQLGIPAEVMAKAVRTFEGVRRRQEIRGVQNNITVIDDFAHHPTAVHETIRAVRPFVTAGRLWAVFEPRTNTSMRNVFQSQYSQVFDSADGVCIREPSALHKVPETQRFSSRQLVADLNRRGVSATYFTDTGKIVDHLVDQARPGDVVLIMSNGGFDNVHERLLAAL